MTGGKFLSQTRNAINEHHIVRFDASRGQRLHVATARNQDTPKMF